ncbi:hypothetical protein EYF80_056464 [Liparis tanakae]|uniref:DUF1720 domain-containing protein n=1 Tax=Liparis tanakae TaxID=230148 RepID=A0A4Z2EX42_9TELE|nr:hypothetical protein EYF80_056464 [Liparis tanakae]
MSTSGRLHMNRQTQQHHHNTHLCTIPALEEDPAAGAMAPRPALEKDPGAAVPSLPKLELGSRTWRAVPGLQPVATGYSPWLQATARGYRLQPVATGYSPGLQATARGYRLQPVATGYSPWLQATARGYRLQPVATGYSPWLQANACAARGEVDSANNRATAS